MDNCTLERAILETLAYSDVFEYPLRLEEIYRYLPIHAEFEQMLPALMGLNGLVGQKNSFYYLTGHENIVEIRAQRESNSRTLLDRAVKYGRMLGLLPFIRMVALTGSLAVMNSAEGADFDYMLVAAPNRVWTARAFALLLNRFAHLFGHTLCPNLIISENSLAWATHDLYSARELCQMVPIAGVDLYQKLMTANGWTKDFLPNAQPFSDIPGASKGSIQQWLELPLRGKPGDSFERWEMNRKIARFSSQAGFGEETIFNADVCQGNFDHHHKRTDAMFRQRLGNLGVVLEETP